MDQVTKDTLRGQSYIGDTESGVPRTCGMCLYGEDEGRYVGRCLTTKPEKFFKEKVVPSELDGKEVGNYCPLWGRFEAGME